MDEWRYVGYVEGICPDPDLITPGGSCSPVTRIFIIDCCCGEMSSLPIYVQMTSAPSTFD